MCIDPDRNHRESNTLFSVAVSVNSDRQSVVVRALVDPQKKDLKILIKGSLLSKDPGSEVHKIL